MKKASKINQKEVNELLENFIIDWLDGDDLRSYTKPKLKTEVEEEFLLCAKEFGVNSLADLTAKQRKNLNDNINDEWKCFIDSIS